MSYYSAVLTSAIVNIIAILSMYTLMGLTGIFSMGQAAFMCVGAVSYTHLFPDFNKRLAVGHGIRIGLVIKYRCFSQIRICLNIFGHDIRLLRRVGLIHQEHIGETSCVSGFITARGSEGMPISGIFFWLLISTRDKQMELASDVMTALARCV